MGGGRGGKGAPNGHERVPAGPLLGGGEGGGGGGGEVGVGGGGGVKTNTEGVQTTKKWGADVHAKR